MHTHPTQRAVCEQLRKPVKRVAGELHSGGLRLLHSGLYDIVGQFWVTHSQSIQEDMSLHTTINVRMSDQVIATVILNILCVLVSILWVLKASQIKDHNKHIGSNKYKPQVYQWFSCFSLNNFSCYIIMYSWNLYHTNGESLVPTFTLTHNTVFFYQGIEIDALYITFKPLQIIKYSYPKL